MSFWGVEVKPNEPFTLECFDLGGPLMLTQATLGVSSSLEKCVLQVNVGDKKPIFVCSLLPEISECFTLNLEFDEEEDVTFSVVGPTSIHLSGYVRGSNADDDDDDDDDEPDFDGFGEDMDEMTLEGIELESEDDREDDSNHDDDMLTHPSSSSHNKKGEKGGSKQVKKKKKKESLAVESDRKAQQQANVESIKADKGKSMKKKNGAKDGDSASNLKRNVDFMDQDEEQTIDAVDGDASNDNKKRKKKKAKAQNDETVANIKQNADEVTQDGGKEEKIVSKVVKETKRSKDKPSKVRNYSNGLIVEELETGKPNGKIASRGKKGLDK